MLTKRLRKYMFLSISKTLGKKKISSLNMWSYYFIIVVNQISLYVIKYLLFYSRQNTSTYKILIWFSYEVKRKVKRTNLKMRQLRPQGEVEHTNTRQSFTHKDWVLLFRVSVWSWRQNILTSNPLLFLILQVI